MIIETSNNRIKVFCKLKGDTHITTAIAFSKIDGRWVITTSMCLPSDLESAHTIFMCYEAAFNALKSMQDSE